MYCWYCWYCLYCWSVLFQVIVTYCLYCSKYCLEILLCHCSFYCYAYCLFVVLVLLVLFVLFVCWSILFQAVVWSIVVIVLSIVHYIVSFVAMNTDNCLKNHGERNLLYLRHQSFTESWIDGNEAGRTVRLNLTCNSRW